MFKVPITLFTLSLAVAVVAQAQTAPTAEQRGFETLKPETLRNDLTYVASDALEGRMSLQAGDDKAIAWIAGEFKKAGLTPAAMDADGKPGYLQSFKLVEYRADRNAFALTLERNGKSTAFHAPEAIGAYKKAVDLTARVVFAGFGITAP
jgi:hypothetical protein